MPISITTLNNEAAAAKTFAEQSKDKTSSVWINTSDTNSSFDSRLQIFQRRKSMGKLGGMLRETLVQHSITVPVSVVVGGNTVVKQEQVIVNCTIKAPELLSTITATQLKDAVAFVRNFLTGANVDLLRQGMV